MARRNPVHDHAKRKSTDVRDALNRLGQWIFPSERLMPGTIPQWETAFRGLIAADTLRGSWELYGYWRFWSDPVTGDVALRESSIGLTVSDHQVNGFPEKVCVARYDVELHGSRRGRHLNVYQPQLGDGVHWVVPTDQFRDWPLEAALSFLVSDALAELTAAGWPAR